MILDDFNSNKKMESHPTHRWFFSSSFIFFVVGLFFYVNFKNSTIDIQLHDTYYVIALFYFPILFGCLLLVYSGLYFLFYKNLIQPLNKNLSRLHFYLTIILLIILLLFFYKNQYYLHSSITTGRSIRFGFIDSFTETVFLFFACAQFLFFINILRSVFFRKNKIDT